VDRSDLHVATNTPPPIRVKGNLPPAPFPLADAHEMQKTLKEVLTPERLEEFHRSGAADFSLSMSGLGRFRGNACLQRGTGPSSCAGCCRWR
jgi:Tfp pilus assembly pilus retraction ATPase PilT